MEGRLLNAADEGDTRTVIALLDRGVNIEAKNSVRFSFQIHLVFGLVCPQLNPNPDPDRNPDFNLALNQCMCGGVRGTV